MACGSKLPEAWAEPAAVVELATRSREPMFQPRPTRQRRRRSRPRAGPEFRRCADHIAATRRPALRSRRGIAARCPSTATAYRRRHHVASAITSNSLRIALWRGSSPRIRSAQVWSSARVAPCHVTVDNYEHATRGRQTPALSRYVDSTHSGVFTGRSVRIFFPIRPSRMAVRSPSVMSRYDHRKATSPA